MAEALERTPSVWIVRAGQNGEAENFALENSCVVIGWHELPDLGSTTGLEDVKKLWRSAFPEDGEARINAQAGQISRFVHDLKLDDIVCLPRKDPPKTVAIGRVTGKYEWHPESSGDEALDEEIAHRRSVEWLSKRLDYGAFDKQLQDAFGIRGTVRELTQPDAAERIGAALSAAEEEPEAVHLVVKWSSKLRADTVERHMEVAQLRGSVWWGLATSGTAERWVAEQRIDQLREQLLGEVPTYVFLSGETCWKTDLVSVVYTRAETDEDLIPAYYAETPTRRYHLWVELANFEPIDRDGLLRMLDPENLDRRGKPIALGNQTNPIFVRKRTTPRVWWVNQGTSFARAREGGHLWAPAQQQGGGTAFDHWRNMKYLRQGDIVLNYANGRIRAVSRVITESVPSPRPDAEADQAWSNEGLRAGLQYHDLPAPVRLGDIPVEWRIPEEGPFARDGNVKQGYLFPLSDSFARQLADRFEQLDLGEEVGPAGGGEPAEPEPDFEDIVEAILREGLTMSAETIRRYHLSLKTRGFVVLSGISGTGKTWLAQAYASAINAESLIVPVAPNWTTNEDLLGYLNPVDGHYHDTEFSEFMREASAEYSSAQAAGREPRSYHLVLDEMNLARVEYYFAKFLSAMELRARSDDASIELAPGDEVLLPPNLRFTGTVNVDETTHGFADKVYDRSQLIELTITRDQVVAHLGDRPLTQVVAAVWDVFEKIAPFAFRVLDEITDHVDEAASLSVPWEAALDEQLLQKVLPKVRGTDLAIGPALRDFIELAADRFPLSQQKATAMQKTFEEHGFTSYF